MANKKIPDDPLSLPIELNKQPLSTRTFNILVNAFRELRIEQPTVKDLIAIRDMHEYERWHGYCHFRECGGKSVREIHDLLRSMGAPIEPTLKDKKVMEVYDRHRMDFSSRNVSKGLSTSQSTTVMERWIREQLKALDEMQEDVNKLNHRLRQMERRLNFVLRSVSK